MKENEQSNVEALCQKPCEKSCRSMGSAHCKKNSSMSHSMDRIRELNVQSNRNSQFKSNKN